jgi:serine/threonine-protein phosphatase 2A activator
MKVKRGPFFEHSPDLYNISGAANWEKINNGMMRKYHDDVLAKFPIMQHLLFGSIFSFQ